MTQQIIGEDKKWLKRQVAIVLASQNESGMAIQMINIKGLVRLQRVETDGPVFEMALHSFWANIKDRLPLDAQASQFLGVLIAASDGKINWVNELEQ
jgi:hypothetical protein